jgi:hypothetical protein
MTWNNVAEQLPSESGWYLVVQHERIQLCPYYAADGFFRESGVTHWMPLPELPKEGK